MATNIDLAGSAGEGQNSCTKGKFAREGGRERRWRKKSEVPITKQIKRERDVGTRSKRGEAARHAAVATDGFGLFALRRRRRGESGCVRGLRMGCTIASDAPIFFEPALLHKNVQLRMGKTNRNHSELLD